MVTGYPDHGFVIDRAESKELFKNVRAPNENEKKLADHLQQIITDNISKKPPFIFNLTDWYHEKKEKGEASEEDEQRDNEKVGECKAGELAEKLPINQDDDEKPINDTGSQETQ